MNEMCSSAFLALAISGATDWVIPPHGFYHLRKQITFFKNGILILFWLSSCSLMDIWLGG